MFKYKRIAMMIIIGIIIFLFIFDYYFGL